MERGLTVSIDLLRALAGIAMLLVLLLVWLMVFIDETKLSRVIVAGALTAVILPLVIGLVVL